MNSDLTALLDLQSKDLALLEVDLRFEALVREVAALDEALERARQEGAAARRAAVEAARRRDELEAKIQGYRTIQDRRRQRIEHTRNAKEAAALMAELDLARSVLAKEENEWLRLAESVSALEAQAAEAERRAEEFAAAQAPERARLAERQAEIEAERERAAGERDAAARRVNRPLLARYDKLKRVKTQRVVVPLSGSACGACYTAVPTSRRSQIRSGVLDGCEACGVILYAAEQSG